MRKFIACAAFVAALALTGVLAAQEPGGSSSPIKGTSKAPAKAGAKKLSLEEVGQMLEEMGYDPKPRINDQGVTTGYEITLKPGTWTVYAYVDISKSTNWIWISWNLMENVGPDTAPEALFEALRMNHKIWPAYIAYFPDTKIVWLAYPLRNSDVTRAEMRTALEGYGTAVKDSLTAWNNAIEAAKAKKVAPKTNPKPIAPPNPDELPN